MKVMDKKKKNEVLEKIGLTEAELNKWHNEVKKMHVSISDEGIIEQFDGYFTLNELDWDAYRQKYGNIHRMDRILKAEGKSPDEFKVSKQADTLMTFYNIDPNEVSAILKELGYKIPNNFLEKNFDYYINRCSHGSTLSRVVHSYIASLIGRNDLSWHLYSEALNSDYVDIQGGTTAEGIHMGVMTGTVLMALTAFAGLNFHGNILSISPNLPKYWKSIEFKCKFRGGNYNFRVSMDQIAVKANVEAFIAMKGKKIELKPNEEHIVDIN
jgi:trehalose/maltose hydrolase-like predicted phosphorylase